MNFDEQIHDLVADELKADHRVRASDVEVEVSGGVVLLKGQVPEYRALSAATMAAWSVDGVSEVRSELVVSIPEEVKAAVEDERLTVEIRDQVRHRLHRRHGDEAADVQVTVDVGVVTYRGTVSEFWQLRRLDDIAENTLGVAGVKSYVTVVPTQSADDNELAARIEKALERSVYVAADLVTVKVVDGEVTLTGGVTTYYGKDRAAAAAGSVPGVTKIHNKLNVTGPLSM